MVSRLERVQAFADAAMAVSSLAELHLLMDRTSREFGVDRFLLIHHADFSDGGKGLVRLGNYPLEFLRISRQDGRTLNDPVMEACERTLTGFFWSDLDKVISLTDMHRERAEAVARTGLGDGLVVPAHIPGEHLGSTHFACTSGRFVPREHAAALQVIATFGVEAARRLVAQQPRVRLASPVLTERQRQCLVLSAKGKSDSVIGQLLDLSPKTVNAYIESAKRRDGVATRNQLIVRALYASEITFLDIVEPGRAGTASAALH